MPQPSDDVNLDSVTDVLLDSGSSVLGDEPLRGTLQVMIIGKASFATVALPGPGRFEIGRNHDCAIQIEETSISRRHARLYVGTELEIEDLGSANGTRVRGRKLAPRQRVPIALGEIAGIGNTTIVVQERPTAVVPRRVWAHEDFEARLDEECARASRSGHELAVLRIETDNAPASLVQEILSEALRQSDVVAMYSPSIHEAMLPETSAAHTDDVVRRTTARMRSRGVECRITSVHAPQHGRTAHALIARLARGTTVGSDLEIVVRDPVMTSLHELAKQIARSDLGMLILGETGVGKDVFAERIHHASPRANKSFLQLNCAGLTESMIDSELFGHEKGAFTGAYAAKPGLLETADGGTVFLDEIGDMPLPTQAKLLRVIEDRKVRRVGGLKAHAIDVRFIAATNRDLESEVNAGTFRRDLYFRLNGASLVIPPLRERTSEIEPLAKLFAARAATHNRLATPVFSDEVLEMFRGYSWPGNVRELKNVVTRATVLAQGKAIGLDAIPVEKMRTTLVTRRSTQPDAETFPTRPRRGPEEKSWIQRALALAEGNQTRAAKLLGISRRTLINRLAEYGFERPRKSDS